MAQLHELCGWEKQELVVGGWGTIKREKRFDGMGINKNKNVLSRVHVARGRVGGGWVEILCECVDRRGVIVGGGGGGNHKKETKRRKERKYNAQL